MSLNQTAPGNRRKLDPAYDGSRLDIHVVILNNYIRPHHVVAYRELEKRVRKLTVLLSVPMEPDRDWEAKWGGLDVRIQKNFMLRTKWKHSTGFKEDNFIHIPIDTYSQLRSLKPDIVFSYEMGMRTLLSGWFRRFNPSVPLVMVGNMSQNIENERGMIRRSLRWMIKKSADYFTYNGPSCKRYLESLKIAEEQLFHLPYCIDQDAVFRGDRPLRSDSEPTRLLYCGALSRRKGVLEFAKSLHQWCGENPERKIQWDLAGEGDLRSKIKEQATDNLEINFLGNCDNNQLREAYGNADICVFPSFADEWGLVPIEALASGIPVLGSVLAQSVETVVEDGHNGWRFDPTDKGSLFEAISRALNCDFGQLIEMGSVGKDSVQDISAEITANKFCSIIQKILPETLVANAEPNVFSVDETTLGGAS